MEGDAGTGQLNHPEPDATSSPTDEMDQTSTAAASPEAAAGTDQTSTEPAADLPEADAAGGDAVVRGPSRLRGRWLIGIAAVLIVLAGVLGAGGYLALRFHRDSQATARADGAAIAAAKDCMTALNAPDPAAMQASQRKIIECATGAFEAQAPMLSSLLADAYAQADVHVQLLDLRAAVERNNDDGSIDVLTVLRLIVSSTGKEVSYRLRVTMAPVDGDYKVAKVDQVAQ
ncbi:hypothetical protein [Mycobacterium talmoniae]|uniref:Mce protein n=1 Tax=Mycobacterium talmoniae TaxID=1858794 RepID=A0A1S1NQP1_9MYCO|nr:MULTISPECIES: hypothetical protein [Mycobacterium]OHV06732.1 hypothetical protein BKN37_00540 [Mycobacterium talmoniae]PQM46051.1 hypothetical protein C1Y40_03781 [Mycobacterium talmoniae]TDH56461.1 hypothetical protein E2F47_07225 [Mycobacterium eburneum]